MFSFICTVVSFPFWIFGSIAVVAAMFGTTYYSRLDPHEENTWRSKILVFSVGVLSIAFAYFLVHI